ncbi:MAG: glucose PTS transporter subunit IIA, partial [Clostridium sp.]
RDEEESEVDIDVNDGKLANKVLDALGGSNNIKDLDACITRLRVTVIDINKVNKKQFKKLGSAGVMQVGSNIQAIFGPKSEMLKSQIKDIMNGKEIFKPVVKKIKEIKSGIDKGISIAIPVSGKIINLEEVPDDVFSMKLIGDGFAIDPSDGYLYSPVKGMVTALAGSYHAITITTGEGMKVFIHIGIDTLKLKGEGFISFVKLGDAVNIGDRIINFPLESIKKNATSPIIPIIFKNLKLNEFIYYEINNLVKYGEMNKVEIHSK